MKRRALSDKAALQEGTGLIAAPIYIEQRSQDDDPVLCFNRLVLEVERVR
jgi:hypothetical protein